MKVLLPLVLFSTLLLSACSQSTDTSALAPTTSTAVTQTETFTGTLAAQGTNIHTFTVAQNGTLTVTLTAAGPPPTIFIGLGVGTPSGTTCSLLVTANAQAGTAAQLTGSVTNPGMFCLAVYDVGNLIADVTYSVTVSHT
jgi:hypothetical protein